jgi:CheY-like chemotaxis protein
MNQPASVLIVDRSADNREVLRTVLQRQGLRIFEAPEAEQGLALARTHQPDVIVLDEECQTAASGQFTAELDAAPGEHSPRLIILGRIPAGSGSSPIRQVAKPYHFAPLVLTIQQLAAKAA